MEWRLNVLQHKQYMEAYAATYMIPYSYSIWLNINKHTIINGKYMLKTKQRIYTKEDKCQSSEVTTSYIQSLVL